MSGKLVMIVLAVATVGVGGYYYANFETNLQYAEDGSFQRVEVIPRGAEPEVETAAPSLPGPSKAVPATAKSKIRIATFNLGGLDNVKLGNQIVGNTLVRVIIQFDVLAVQNIRADNRGVLAKLIQRINAAGGNFDYAICPSVVSDPVGQHCAFLFNRDSVAVDRSTVQSIGDPSKRFRHRPLVGSFRAVGPKEAEAFTFTLVNVHNEPQNAEKELDLLDDVYREVCNDGRKEDDVIMLGDFGSDGVELGQLTDLPDMAPSIVRTPTTTRGTRLADNIFFNRRSTVEFTGMSGVLDLMRICDLTIQEAMAVSDHLPVWAEFSRYEGGQSGYVSRKPGRTTR
jgi:deoxyribonuclease-1-like protein